MFMINCFIREVVHRMKLTVYLGSNPQSLGKPSRELDNHKMLVHCAQYGDVQNDLWLQCRKMCVLSGLQHHDITKDSHLLPLIFGPNRFSLSHRVPEIREVPSSPESYILSP